MTAQVIVAVREDDPTGPLGEPGTYLWVALLFALVARRYPLLNNYRG